MRFKYPSTNHLPFSPGLQNDDRRIETLDGLYGQEVVVTEKMDGENTTMGNDIETGPYIHARSLDSRHHPSRDWVKKYWGAISYLIPSGWRICGENVYAQHSVRYTDLDTYFYGFSIWNAENVALSWDETMYYFKEIFSIKPVPVLYRGEFDLKVLEKLAENINPHTTEGFVVRTTAPVIYEEFDLRFAKWVRKGHVQTSEHWMTAEVIPNGLCTDR